MSWTSAFAPAVVDLSQLMVAVAVCVSLASMAASEACVCAEGCACGEGWLFAGDCWAGLAWPEANKHPLSHAIKIRVCRMMNWRIPYESSRKAWLVKISAVQFEVNLFQNSSSRGAVLRARAFISARVWGPHRAAFARWGWE